MAYDLWKAEEGRHRIRNGTGDGENCGRGAQRLLRPAAPRQERSALEFAVHHINVSVPQPLFIEAIRQDFRGQEVRDGQRHLVWSFYYETTPFEFAAMISEGDVTVDQLSQRLRHYLRADHPNVLWMAKFCDADAVG